MFSPLSTSRRSVLQVRNAYDKKITYAFFPVPEGDKITTFSCNPKVRVSLRIVIERETEQGVYALSVSDTLPTKKEDLREAFDAACAHLTDLKKEKVSDVD